MSEASKPEVGGVFVIEGDGFQVTSVQKRGRGYRVNGVFMENSRLATYRLRDFNKKAKPV